MPQQCRVVFHSQQTWHCGQRPSLRERIQQLRAISVSPLQPALQQRTPVGQRYPNRSDMMPFPSKAHPCVFLFNCGLHCCRIPELGDLQLEIQRQLTERVPVAETLQVLAEGCTWLQQVPGDPVVGFLSLVLRPHGKDLASISPRSVLTGVRQSAHHPWQRLQVRRLELQV